MNKSLWFSSTAEFIPPLVCSIGDDGATDTGGGGTGPSSTTSSDNSSGTTAQTSQSVGGDKSAADSTPPASPSSPSSSDQSSDFDFGSIFGEPAPAAGSVKEPAATSAAATKTEAKPGEPPATPAVAQPPVQPQTPPVQAPVTSDQGSASGAAPRYDLNDPASMSQALGQMQDAAVDSVAKTLFALSPKDIEGLETNAADTIPRLLARVFVVSQQQYLQQMARMIPAMMSKHTSSQEAYRTNEDAFFKAWPQLNKAQHGDVIRRVGQVWRAQNPNATLEQAIAEIGPMAMMIAKVPAAAPQASRSNGRASPSPAFVPAVSGATSASAPAQVNPFEFLGEQG